MTSKAPATGQDLLEAMAENIQRLRDGETTPSVANSMVNNASVILRIVKMQMEYAKMTGVTPSIPMLLTLDSRSERSAIAKAAAQQIAATQKAGE